MFEFDLQENKLIDVFVQMSCKCYIHMNAWLSVHVFKTYMCMQLIYANQDLKYMCTLWPSMLNLIEIIGKFIFNPKFVVQLPSG